MLSPASAISIANNVGKPRRNISEADRAAAKRLRDLWASYRKAHPDLSQDKAGATIGFSQAVFSQYLRCIIPLGLAATIKFGRLFGVPPETIRPDMVGLVDKMPKTARQPQADYAVVGPQAREIAIAWSKLSPGMQEVFRELLFVHAFIEKKYPWLRKGKPKGAGYDNWERHQEQNMEAMIQLAADRTSRKPQ